MFLGSKPRPMHRADITAVSRLSRQCGILNISQPYRPSRPVTGIALLHIQNKLCNRLPQIGRNIEVETDELSAESETITQAGLTYYTQPK
jgi:hypothetical protein